MKLFFGNGRWIGILVMVLVGCSSSQPSGSVPDNRPEAVFTTTPIDSPAPHMPPNVSPPAASSRFVSSELARPVRLKADGEPIDIGKLSEQAYAGPWIADVDEDGDADLLVGDFNGHFWFFQNVGTDSSPRYASKGKLQAGKSAAKVHVY